jgi:hypothetical protein
VGGTCGTHEREDRKVYRVLVGKPEGKRALGITRRRLEDGIRMDLRKIGLGSVDWIKLGQDRGQWWALVKLAGSGATDLVSQLE